MMQVAHTSGHVHETEARKALVQQQAFACPTSDGQTLAV